MSTYYMMDKFCIAHLSDLHCNGSSEWKNSFDYIVEALKKKGPNLIVITGDLVNNPFDSNFIVVKDSIKRLYNDIKCPIISVPGNHDYSFFGNCFFNLQTRKKLYKEYEQYFSLPDSPDVIAKKIFLDHNISLFNIDSNSSNLIFGFAIGKVESPLTTLNNIKMCLKSTHGCKEKYNNSIKIAILHHHPLPLPSKNLDKISDNLIFLRNAHEFLDACCEVGIDVILHGHKHISGLSKYQIYNADNSSTAVSACGTSNKNSATREIKFAYITPSGACSIESYVCEKYETRFTKNSDEVNVNYYGDIRKSKITKRFFVPNAYQCPVTMVANKEKIIQIFEDGNSLVQTALYGIQWKNNVSPQERYIKEIIWADMGRIWGGLYEFGKSPIIPAIPERQCEWRNPILNEGKKPAPDQPEMFTLTLTPGNNTNSHDEDCLKNAYILLNGFTMNQEEHQEAYPDWDYKIPRQEIASTSVNYPTYQLELIVRFPENFFPNPDGISLNVTFKKEPTKETPLALLYDQNKINHEESNFLKEKASLRRRSALNEVAIIIKYPNPDCVYSLKWIVPPLKKQSSLELEAAYKRGFEMISNEIMQTTSKCVDNFYQEVDNFVKFLGGQLDEKTEEYNALNDIFPEKFRTTKSNPQLFASNSVNAFLFGYKQDKKVLSIVKTPAPFKNKVKNNLSPGRGPAGRAFKSRVPCYWERKKEDEDIENVIEGMHPVHVLAFPLMYPTKSMAKKLKYQGRLPSFGVLSLAATDENGLSGIATLDEETRSIIVTLLSMFMDKFIEKAFASILPPQKSY